MTNNVKTYMKKISLYYLAKKIFKDKQSIPPIITLFITFILTFSIMTGCINKDKPKEAYEIYVTLSYDQVNNSLLKAESWLLNDINEFGYFNYSYDPIEDTYSSENNMVRQLMASRLLAELSQTNESLRPIHKKNLEYVFSNWYQEKNDTGYIFYDNKSKLGEIAMALRTIIYSPYYEEYSLKANYLARTILQLQNDDGSFKSFYIISEGSYTDYYFEYHLMFYSGEAILSLVEYYLKTDNISYLDAAEKSQNYYIQKYVKEIDENYNPVYVPWQTISLNKLFKITQNQNYSESIFILNDKLVNLQDIVNMQTLGRFYNSSTPDYGNPHSASDGIYTEGLAYAYEIALMVDDKIHQDSYDTSLVLGLYNLMSLQYNESDKRLDGAIKVNIDNSSIRLDKTQHMIDAFRKSIDVKKDEDNKNWSYFYYPELGSLIKSKQEIIVRGNTGVWYALAIGTIIALVFIVIVFYVMKKKKK